MGAGGRGRRRPSPASPAPAAGRGRWGAAARSVLPVTRGRERPKARGEDWIGSDGDGDMKISCNVEEYYFFIYIKAFILVWVLGRFGGHTEFSRTTFFPPFWRQHMAFILLLLF